MGRQRIVLAALVLTMAHAFSAGAQCETGGGIPVQQGCGSFTYAGCCDGQLVYWCEQGWICYTDCTAAPYCGWRDAANFYACDTPGQPARGNNPPMQCPALPAQDDDGDGYTEDQGDCDDTNPWVNPSAAENCANGIDDDCDGAIDTADSDCPQGDDDDHVGDDDDHVGDDDDVGDDDQQHADDDTQGPTDDDDTTPGGNHQQQYNENPHLGIVCGCRTTDRTPASPALVLLLMAGIVAARRAR